MSENLEMGKQENGGLASGLYKRGVGNAVGYLKWGQVMKYIIGTEWILQERHDDDNEI